MPRKKKSPKAALVPEIYDLLLKCHGPQKCYLDHTTALELLVATILSAQCTDKMVNIVTKDLFQKYKTAADYASAKPGELEQDIRKCGYYHAKAAHIIGACGKICRDFGGKVPRTMEELTTLPGVGRKTANVVLGDFYNVPGLPVDTHVTRLSNRLGLCTTERAEEIEQILCAVLEPEKWAQFSHLLIIHGRRVCPAAKPKCEECVLAELCSKRGVKK